MTDVPGGRPMIWRSDSSAVLVGAPEGDGFLSVGVDGVVEPVPRDGRRVLRGPIEGRLLTRVGDGPVRLEDATGAVLATAPEGATPCPKGEAELSPDASRVVTFARGGCRGGVVEIWGEDGVLATRSTGGAPAIKTPEWSPDGERLAIVYGAGILLLLDRDGAVVPTPEDLCERVDAAAWRPDSQRLSVACEYSDKVVLLDRDGAVVGGWDTNPTGDPDAARGVHLSAWSADGSRFATLDHSGNVGLWPADGPDGAFAAPDTTNCEFSPDGASVVSMTERNEQILWTRDGERVATLSDVDRAKGTGAWSSDGARWAAVAAGDLRLVTAATGQESSLPVSVGTAEWIAWSPDDARLAVVGTAGAVLVDATDGVLRSLEGIEGGVQTRTPPNGAWSPDGGRLLVAQDEGLAWLFDGDGALLLEFERGRNVHVHWHPSGERFQVSASPWESHGTLYDRDGTELKETDGVVISPWSPDGTQWVVSRGKRAWLVTAADEQAVVPMDLRAWFWSAAWTTLGSRIVVRQIGALHSLWGADGTLELELAGGDPTEVCVDPREEFLLTNGPAGLTRWPLGDEPLMSAADGLAPQGLLERDRLLLE